MSIAIWIRQSRILLLSTFGVLLLAGDARAQKGPATLTLDEAISIGRRNNPEFLTVKSNEAEADWAVREAYGNLMPSASIGGGMSYQAAGVERVGASFANRNRTGYLSSSYSLGMSLRLAGESFMLPKQQNANRDAVLAQIDAADFNLVANITRQYLAVRRAQDGAQLARRELERARENQRLVETRVEVGTAIALDAKQAAVETGRAEVELLRAENLEYTEKLRLIEIIGLDLDPEVTLTSELPVFDPVWAVDDLTAMAVASHPQLRALQASRRASAISVRMAKTQYLPSLSISAGFSGHAQRATNADALIEVAQNQLDESRASCIEMNKILENLTTPMPRDCSAANFQLTPDQITRIRDDNSGLPFDFTRQPISASLQISLPIFNGFSRERRLAAARIAADDAEHRVRREELRIKTDVATAYQNLVTARRAVTLEERNRDLAADQLTLARERYTVGAISFVELKEAETTMARADRAYLVAIYTFHESLAALENAVGRKLDHLHEGRP